VTRPGSLVTRCWREMEPGTAAHAGWSDNIEADFTLKRPCAMREY
jgi:hypothetical protein